MTGAHTRQVRRVGEGLTLIGMVAAVVGASLSWPLPVTPAPLPLATYVSHRPHMGRGFDLTFAGLNLGWLIAACAVASGAMLLWDPGEQHAKLAAGVQIGLGLAVFGLAAAHFGAYSGVICALVGALCLMWGAIGRYGKESTKI